MYNSGSVSNTDLEGLQTVDPTKYAEVKTLINKAQSFNKFREMLYGKEVTSTKVDGEEATGTGDGFEEYKKAVNSEEVKKLNETIQTKQTEYDTLNAQLLAVKEEIEKEFE
jgi:hypothetical protein